MLTSGHLVKTAMNRPHGDQIATRKLKLVLTLAVHESSEAATPIATLGMREWICEVYSFRTMDDGEASWSAEW